MLATMFDVVDRMTRDVVEVCASLPTAQRELEIYHRKFQRPGYVRRTQRMVGTKEDADLHGLIRDSRQRREDAYEDHLRAIVRKTRVQGSS